LITQILIHTPLWVYGLFIVLVAFGLQQTRSRNVNAVLAYFLPLGMIALSLAGINSSFGIKPAPIAMWAIGLLIVTVIGFKRFRDDRVTFTRSSRSFFIPGSWTPFFVIMAIFFTKYVFAVIQAFDAEVVTTKAFVAALSLAYGCFSGYFSSRAINLVSKAKAAQP
jgi:predicted membrane protein